MRGRSASMKSLSKFQRRCLTAALGGVMFIRGANAALAAGHSSVAVDPAFTNGLAALTTSTGFIESRPGPPQTQWQPNLQVLVGVRAVEGEKQTVRIVELTTLRPPPTNAWGQPWTPPLRTNKWNWAITNSPTATSQSAEYVSPIYPVRVRVFDETGGALTEGITALPWSSLTNTLVDLCRISLALNISGTPTNSGLAVTSRLHPLKRRHLAEPKLKTATLKPAAPSAETSASPPAESEDEENDNTPQKFRENDDLMRSVGGGFLWMMTMFDQLRTVPAVRGIWEKVRYAVRLPNVWTVATSVFKGRFELSLQPQFADISLANPAAGKEIHYYLPVQMNFGKQNLARLDIIVGPANGAEMLLAGIKSVRAAHPARPDQELTAQVLATGSVRPAQ
jgi:hypothetical protein